VNTGVRSPGTMNPYRRAVNALKRALEMILYGVAMRLALPASEWRAVVSDDQFKSA
jgi:hypothetical protein